ncbi:MAG: GspH/FimT family pseudopilin [Rubrivivax sp.]|nr:GspH/FimT family pseudopilin [Rubrivivax sp.]
MAKGHGLGGRGFSLIEFMVTVTLAALLLGLATPSFLTWTRNAQVRTVTDSLQNGLRMAQAEAVRRQRQVVFFLTENAACDLANTASANGRFWVIRTVPLLDGEGAQVVQCGALADVAAGTTITGPTALCFGSAGRLVANATPGAGAGVQCLPGNLNRYDVTRIGADRALRVTVSLGGQTRLCDPARTLTDAQPDGCPA